MLVFWIGNVCVALRTYSHTFRAGLGGTGRVGLGSSGAGLGWDESIAQAHVLPTSFSGRLEAVERAGKTQKAQLTVVSCTC